MTATDELRKFLDERGVEWRDGDATDTTVWKMPDGRPCSAMHWNPKLSVCIGGCTPEQAIAATLGGGKLTAEQVRELIAPYLYAKPTFDFGHHGAVWSADFQAIADELNITLGAKTCRQVDENGYNFRFKCSVCGYAAIVHNCETRLDELPNYCPSCGRKVERC